ncbi:hypothetical protein [Halorhabdus sp. CUG00001]|uniref:hypothetical protein n=1 Tax=Halorhabdus sp. CUG00001 TaxID=2600297 RepID=UPI00131C7B8B|nr:hypothetical protein [Halorhabdus sp. CUG00001]
MKKELVALLVVLVSITAVTGAMVTATAVSSDQERAFFSDDDDINGSQLSNPNEPENFVKIADIPYYTTKPEYEIGNTTLFEYQKDSLDNIDSDLRSSFVLDRSETTDSNIIKDAHVTFLGIHGGAMSLARSGRHGSHALANTFVIGSEGTVLSHLDYRIREDIPPADYCGPKDKDTRTRDYDNDSVVETFWIDGSQTCYRYSMEVEDTRRVSIGGRSFSGEDTIQYTGLTSNSKVDLSMRGSVSVRVTETRIYRDWNPRTRYADGWSDGYWDSTTGSPSLYREDSVSLSSASYDTLVTDTGDLDIHQRIINVNNETSHIVLTLDGPRGNNAVRTKHLMDRLLWSHLTIGSGTAFVDSTWRTYSARQYTQARRFTESGSNTIHSPPQVPRTFLIGTDRRPTINPVDRSSSVSSSQIIGFEGYNVTLPQTNHSEVTIDPSVPIEYSRLVIQNAPGNVTSLRTIHGKRVEVDVDEVLQYRQPNVSITAISDNRVKIHVEDPATNQPLGGRQVRLYGVDPNRTNPNGVAITDASGDVVGKRTNTLVRARVQQDDWESPTGSVFYGQTVASRTFLPNVLLLERAHSLLETILLVAPLVFLYGYIRHFGLFE